LCDIIRVVGLVLTFGVFPVTVEASGTTAGTIIRNTAILSYSLGGAPAQTITSRAANVTVAQLINLTLISQDAAAVVVTSPNTNGALTFLLTNTGNGTESFSLTRNNAVAGDNFDPISGSAGAIFLESGLQPGFQASGPNADVPYISGGTNPTLAADSSRIVYVVSNTPGSLANGSTGVVTLTAASMLPGAAGAPPGTTLVGMGPGGIDAVVGGSRGQASRNGTYLVSGVGVAVVKSVADVTDPQGGSDVTSGALVTYRIVVSTIGAGTAQGLSVIDPIPPNTTYVTNSILVDGVSRSDAADGDNAESSAGAVRVQFGDAIAPVSHIVQFRVTIN